MPFIVIRVLTAMLLNTVKPIDTLSLELQDIELLFAVRQSALKM